MSFSQDKVLIIGASGFLGRVLCDLPGYSWQCIPASRSGNGHLFVDLARTDTIEALVKATCPRWVIHTAAMTSVDGCELHPEAAHIAHVEGTRSLVRACEQTGSGLVYLSTNYVFDGLHGPYVETDLPNPLNVYGQTKLDGEKIVLNAACSNIVVRTVVLYGHRPGCRFNFVTWALSALSRGEPIRVVNDEWANPTWVDDLAAFLLEICQTDFQGVVHFGGRDFLTRFEMVQRLCSVFGFEPNLVTPVGSAEFGQPARRPLRAGLCTDLAQSLCDVTPAGFDDHLKQLLSMIADPKTLR